MNIIVHFSSLLVTIGIFLFKTHDGNAFTISNIVSTNHKSSRLAFGISQPIINPLSSSGLTILLNSKHNNIDSNKLIKVPDDDDTPIAFLDPDTNTFIECYADSKAIVNGIEYTIGSPCDYSVALCYFDKGDQLVPIELDEDLMDEVFPVAASIVEEEFGEELSLERTPQTLTLVGELEEGEEEDDESDEDENGDDDMDDDEEEVEILLTFEHNRREYNLVRLLDPVLLVGKGMKDENKCILLTPDESDEVMPILEEMFLRYQEERDGLAF
jgi:hypothetical protein